MNSYMKENDFDHMLCGSDLKVLDSAVDSTSAETSRAIEDESKIRDSVNELISEVESLSDYLNLNLQTPDALPDIDISVNTDIDRAISEITSKAKLFPALSTTELIVSALAGTLSVIIDVVLVGTPEIVKIYRGGENFDGSVLTSLIRKIQPGDGTEAGSILKWLSDKCKVPYDLSCIKGTVNPNNHRLRGLGHDPYLGLFFAVTDIIMGTTTCIDNDGALRIIPNYAASASEKILSVFYYLGHIVSDLFTARGIPVPGFFLTQFFTGDGEDTSLAEIAKNMYMDGYDTRHLASMAVPVVVKDLIVEAFCRITKPEINGFLPLAEKEQAEQQYNLKKEKMLFISNSVGAAGNLVKFVAPPSCCNPCSLNAAQWFAFIRSSISMTVAATRDRSAESVLDGRSRINQKWDLLLG